MIGGEDIGGVGVMTMVITGRKGMADRTHEIVTTTIGGGGEIGAGLDRNHHPPEGDNMRKKIGGAEVTAAVGTVEITDDEIITTKIINSTTTTTTTITISSKPSSVTIPRGRICTRDARCTIGTCSTGSFGFGFGLVYRPAGSLP